MTLKPPSVRPRPAWSDILSGLQSLRLERTPLRFLPADSVSGVWTGLSLHGQARESLRGATPLRAAWHAYALPGSRVRAWCARLDSEGPSDLIRAVIDVRQTDRTWQAIAEVRTAGRWHEVRLDLPGGVRGEIEIDLSAASTASASAAWGDPALERRRTLAELLRAALAAVRGLGIRGLARRAASIAREAEDTERYRRHLCVSRERPEARDTASGADAAGGPAPLVSIITPVFNTDAILLRRAIESVRQQTCPRWELCLSDDGSTSPETRAVLDSARADPRVRVVRSDTNRGIVDASNAALACATGEFVGLMDHDDELYPEALAEVLARLRAQPSPDIVYTDEDKIDLSGLRGQPHFKPDWSPELLRSCMYTSHFTVMRRSLVEGLGGFRPGYEGAQDYDLMLRAVERTDRIAHVPRVLYGWRTTPQSAASSQLAKPWAVRAARRALEDAIRREGVAAAVVSAGAAGHFRVKYAIAGAPLVSVLVVRSREAHDTSPADSLVQCVRAIARHTPSPAYEIIVAGGDGLSAASDVALARTRHTVLPPGGTAAEWTNRAVRSAAGDHLLILHGEVEPFEPDWLDAMLEFSQREEVGAVGAFLWTADGRIAHGGIVLGAERLGANAFEGEPVWTRGHMSNALDIRDVAAVSGACLMTRRSVFDRVGGLDEALGRDLYDVDYSLRVRQAGYRVVVTPHARLRHLAARTAPGGWWPEDVARLRTRWGAALETDPYYNPNFDRSEAGYRLPPVAPTCRSM